MLTRVKSAVANFMGGVMNAAAAGPHAGGGGDHAGSHLPLKFPYTRPEFLGLTPDEAERSADHATRPVLTSRRETDTLPWATGYAEVINAGKSALNEDQASCELVGVRSRPAPSTTPGAARRSSLPNGDCLQQTEQAAEELEVLSYHYWALFDGHAGSGVAVVASRLLHHHVAGQLQAVAHVLRGQPFPPPTVLDEEPPHAAAPPLEPGSQRSLCRATSLRGAPAGAPAGAPCCTPPAARYFMEKKIQCDSLVVGALENDAQVQREKQVFNISGGAIIIRNSDIISMSSEFTPESERQRLQFLGFMQPHLLGRDFTHLEFPRRVQRAEVGKKMLYRDFTMMGWAYKTIEDEDLRFPLVYGQGKKARVLATIGVTRGLGDHDLKVHDSNIYIKPFLSCCPEVRVYNLAQHEHGTDDVLVMGTDGLWDVLSNQEAAQDLVLRARGVLRDRGWRISDERLGSGDDISVFVVPLMGGNQRL
ncbi:hypothetical protein NHX12_020642 [Muraenolepis orangiensis]|uniref:PPM-type phosphatase domain-containing protein n=1 Tax=Muraenolepis orangiensis TaxID=630683 RepID=A0A9Q0ES90_9TELE|nr:hypothetical protein NHX12_020642 [Muraenolepis orangiensis]